MKAIIRKIVCLALFVLVAPCIGRPCTTFLIQHNGQIAFGKNYDWITGNGVVCTNQKGLYKSSYRQSDGDVISWLSKYGSISFNQYGKEFPTGGMNEAGLVIELMWMDGTHYPLPDDRPSVSELQWIQYQLDNCVSVEEVISTDTLLRISSSATPLHFLIADSGGNAAVIEFINGKMVAYWGKELPYSVLTNNFYSSTLKHMLNSDNSKIAYTFTFQGNSLERFVTASNMVKNYPIKSSNKSVIDYSFDVLESVKQSNFTKWSIVYDISQRKIYFKSELNPELKWVNFSNINFSCLSNQLFFNINQGMNGNISKNFIPFSDAVNKRVLEVTAEDGKNRIQFSQKSILDRVLYATTFTCM
jgi:penicillin V acylase-like amidase (Ntn superfamily)